MSFRAEHFGGRKWSLSGSSDEKQAGREPSGEAAFSRESQVSVKARR